MALNESEVTDFQLHNQSRCAIVRRSGNRACTSQQTVRTPRGAEYGNQSVHPG